MDPNKYKDCARCGYDYIGDYDFDLTCGHYMCCRCYSENLYDTTGHITSNDHLFTFPTFLRHISLDS